MSNKHPHAELMMEYAKDAMETSRPWARWEQRVDAGECWSALVTQPAWLPGMEYRRRPRTITICNMEVPEPLREAPVYGSHFYIADASERALPGERYQWAGDSSDQCWLRRGLIHLTREAAQLHARALILASGGEV